MPAVDPAEQRAFAVEAVRQLREAGHEAYLAGGCVRDQLLGRVPKDYDVATSALPDAVRDLFGRRKTLAIGAAFGVITVRGPKHAGQIEVATFREDHGYSDGRRPDSVTFSSAEADAQRRDFTINGLFFDPLAERVLDFVGGQADLAAGVVRAIGRPAERFGEDKLRMLRAVRFTATFDFQLDADTLAAVQQLAQGVANVSAERINAEMQRMLVDPHRVRAVRLLVESRLAPVVLPEIVAGDDPQRLERAATALQQLQQPGFPLALAVLLQEFCAPEGVEAVGRRWRLSRQDTEAAEWLVAQRDALSDAARQPWSRLQPILVAPGVRDLVALVEACWPERAEDLAFVRQALKKPRSWLDPPPLISGDDLQAAGLQPGPAFGPLLRQLRAAQLDGQIGDKEAALSLARKLSRTARAKKGK